MNTDAGRVVMAIIAAAVFLGLVHSCSSAMVAGDPYELERKKLDQELVVSCVESGGEWLLDEDKRGINYECVRR